MAKTYAEAGVDISAGKAFVKAIGPIVRATAIPGAEGFEYKRQLRGVRIGPLRLSVHWPRWRSAMEKATHEPVPGVIAARYLLSVGNFCFVWEWPYCSDPFFVTCNDVIYGVGQGQMAPIRKEYVPKSKLDKTIHGIKKKSKTIRRTCFSVNRYQC